MLKIVVHLFFSVRLRRLHMPSLLSKMGHGGERQKPLRAPCSPVVLPYFEREVVCYS